MAAAALAVSLASSQATPVYSQNVVGYATLPTPNPGTYYLLEVPFVEGVSNGANEVFGTDGATSGLGLPDGTLIETWDFTHQTFVTAVYDTTVGSNPTGWYLYDDTTPGPIPVITPGQGYFVSPAAPVTHTFVGTVAVNIGASKNLNLTSPGAYYLVGAVIPFAGPVDSASGVNLTGLPDGSLVETWDTTHQTYVTAVYDTTVGSNPANWYLYDDTTPGPDPSIIVGQGFFVSPAAPYVWSETLTP
jgi:hypothetical protein